MIVLKDIDDSIGGINDSTRKGSSDVLCAVYAKIAVA